MHTTLRRVAAFGATLALGVAMPAVAQAATLTNDGGTLTYTGGAADAGVVFSQLNPAIATVRVESTDDAIATTGCTGGPTIFLCANVTLVVGDGGGGNDTVQALSGIGIPMHLSGGAGNDYVIGGDGADTIDGGAGDDQLSGERGPDAISGGPGIDSGNYYLDVEPPATAAPALSISLDGVANDGTAGEGDNFAADIEDLNGGTSFDPGTGGAIQFGAVTFTGNDGGNQLSTEAGVATITGGNGNDLLTGGIHDDTLNARDGFADRVVCGPGTDTVVADTLDQVSGDCENVSIADVGNAGDDKPPAIAWAAPPAGAALPGSTVATLQVTATDDKGVAKVDFMDDDRVVCIDTAAPFTCAYQARGDDLGRNTLIAVATDGLGQTASSARVLIVTPFKTTLSLTAGPATDKAAPYSFTLSGKLALPAGVTSALGCSGAVKITVKAGSKTRATRTLQLSKTCTYKFKLTFGNRRGFPANGKLKVKAAFAGNDTISAASSSMKTVSTK